MEVNSCAPRRRSQPAVLRGKLTKRRLPDESTGSPEISESFEDLLNGAADGQQRCPDWLKLCSWDSGPGRGLRASKFAIWLRSSNLGRWLGSHCPPLTNLLLLKVALWLIQVWILSDLHLGLPCFLLALTYWLYEGPLQRAVDRAKSQLRGRAQTREARGVTGVAGQTSPGR